LLVLIAACVVGLTHVVPGSPVAAPSTGDASSAAAPDPSCPSRVLATLDARARAGQLVMVGAALADPTSGARAIVNRIHPVGVLLTGRSRAGARAVAERSLALQDAALTVDPRIGMFLAVDQEGGEVQTLTGDGFSKIPPAAEQGTWTPTALGTAAQGWGRELASAGVNLDLAPVSDVLSPALRARNSAVGANHRAYGTEPASVTAGVLAFAEGLRSAGVDTAVKHFPGLGQVTTNTDFSANVRDTTTGTTSPTLEPFRAAISAGVPFVMVSSAIYTKLDRANPAVFSPAIIGGLLRKEMRFSGVVISDDLGNAASVSGVRPADRATRFVEAGGDVVLTVDPGVAPAMVDGLVDRVAASPRFAAQLETAVGRVLTAKAARGLLRC
jgi:beta-N-acetylhexosaminidase